MAARTSAAAVLWTTSYRSSRVTQVSKAACVWSCVSNLQKYLVGINETYYLFIALVYPELAVAGVCDPLWFEQGMVHKGIRRCEERPGLGGRQRRVEGREVFDGGVGRSRRHVDANVEGGRDEASGRG